MLGTGYDKYCNRLKSLNERISKKFPPPTLVYNSNNNNNNFKNRLNDKENNFNLTNKGNNARLKRNEKRRLALTARVTIDERTRKISKHYENINVILNHYLYKNDLVIIQHNDDEIKHDTDKIESTDYERKHKRTISIDHGLESPKDFKISVEKRTTKKRKRVDEIEIEPLNDELKGIDGLEDIEFFKEIDFETVKDYNDGFFLSEPPIIEMNFMEEFRKEMNI